MSSNRRVIWSDGLIPLAQHLQQQEQYFERYVETRCQALVPHGWGFVDLEVERDRLVVGTFGLRRATAIFPDGTPVRFPDDDPTPSAIDIRSDVRDQVVCLAVPAGRGLHNDREAESSGLSRQPERELEVIEVPRKSEAESAIEVGGLRTHLILSSEVTPAYLTIPVARIVERRTDKAVVLDDQFIPTVLRAGAARRLQAFLVELQGLLHQRGDALSGRVASTVRGVSAEIAEFLMLQVINRYEPLVAHLAHFASVHPENLYRLCVMVSGELSTFSNPGKRPPPFSGYAHDRLQESFEPVMSALRSSLSSVLEQAAIAIPIESKKFGISVAIVADRSLYSQAVFVLAVRADMPAEELRRRFPSQVKIGPVERIRDLVNLDLIGVPVHAIPVAPRQIPYYAGFFYFELDQSHELWSQMKSSGGLAIHLSEFPGLTMELWAIRA
jgi:type VI secretion system protein ImpJ